MVHLKSWLQISQNIFYLCPSTLKDGFVFYRATYYFILLTEKKKESNQEKLNWDVLLSDSNVLTEWSHVRVWGVYFRHFSSLGANWALCLWHLEYQLFYTNLSLIQSEWEREVFWGFFYHNRNLRITYVCSQN